MNPTGTIDAGSEDPESLDDDLVESDDDGDEQTTTAFDDADLSDFDEDPDALADLTPKEQNARNLEIRRAIEQRMEQKRLENDIDYLDMEFDDE